MSALMGLGLLVAIRVRGFGAWGFGGLGEFRGVGAYVVTCFVGWSV